MAFRLHWFLIILAFSLMLIVAGVPHALPLLAMALPRAERRRRRRVNKRIKGAQNPFSAVPRWVRKVNDVCGRRQRADSAANVYRNRAQKNRERGNHRTASLYRQGARAMRAREQALAKRCRESKQPPRIFTARQLGLTFQWVFGGTGTIFRGGGHYSAGQRARNAEETIARTRGFHSFHASLRWGGISYPAVGGDDGTIVLANPPGRRSAQVAGQNTGMIGICVPGTTGDRITEACAKSIEWLLDNWHTTAVPAAHRIDRPARQLDWRGHKQFPGQSTLCPGDMLPDYARIWRA